MAESERKRTLVDNLFHHSDLSVESIASQADLSPRQVQKIVDDLVGRDALQAMVEHCETPVGDIMTEDVITLDRLKTVHEAAEVMTQKGVGSVLVTDKGRPFGIITERDIVRGLTDLDSSFKKLTLDKISKRPLVSVEPFQTIEEAAEIMTKNKIRRLPVLKSGILVGIVTVTDLAVFLSPTRRAGLVRCILDAMTRAEKK